MARKIGARQLANIAHGAARSSQGQQMGALFMALARVLADWCVNEFNAKGLANTAWAFAKAGQPDVQLFMAFRKAL